MTSTTNNLGRLEKVDLRHVWLNEAGDFTPWLAQEENIALLSDTIGIDLEVEAEEKEVGPFRADILCKDTASGDWVLVENQLEKTDHTHLGQLMTYAAGLNAVTIVWISHTIREEHRAALDWLNEITNKDFNFFGLEVELWKIGDSNIAPKFNVVSKPNDWTRSISGAAHRLQDADLTDTKKLQLEYWTAFRELLEERGSLVRPTKPQPQHWQDFSIGRSDFVLRLFANTRDRRIGVILVLGGNDAKAYFNLLVRDRDSYDNLISDLEWDEMLDKKESHIKVRWSECDPTENEKWPLQHEWLYENLQAFHRVFSQPIKQLNAAEYVAESVDE